MLFIRLLGKILKLGGAAAMMVTLAACAYAPGMAFSPDEPLVPTDPDSIPVITPINLETVRQNNRRLEAQRELLRENQDYEVLFAPQSAYRIGTGDVISIVVWDHPELVLPTQTYNVGNMSIPMAALGGGAAPQGYVVDHDGFISFPYAGKIRVGGMTEPDALKAVTSKLSVVLNDPQVTVRITGYRSQKVYLDGEVQKPGVYPISDVSISLADVLNMAGGVKISGDASELRFTRSGKTYVLNMPQLIRSGKDPSRIPMKSGDIVKVVSREENKIFVMGEVTQPSTVTLRNGRLTLNEALGDAGGVNPLSSDPRHIYVIRYDANQDRPAVYHLDGKSPVALALAENFSLQSRDVVYVDSAPIVRWNRFISNLLPGLNTTFLGARVAKTYD